LLAGYVVDEYGKKIRGVLIDVTPLERSGEGAPTSIESDSDGSFHIHGLQPGLTYILSAQTLREGAKLAGQVYAKPPNARILLSLREGVALPAGDARQELPSPSGKKPRTPLPAPIPLADDSQRGDDSWAPTGPPSTNLPKSDTVPSSPRPELTTDGPPPGFRLPATNIAPPPINSVPSAPTIPPLPPTDFRQSQSIRPKNEFVLIDTMGRPKDFPHGREGELVLLEFLTTECVYCKKIIPYLKDLQSRYGARGLDVIGVLCDEIDTQQRRAIAASYQRSQDLNYQLYVEPGRRPGNVRDKFRVEAYPTMLLLSSDGTILWRGSPPHLASLEQAIEDHLGR
jgi:thiol-disulfide isomerase/thioredoxin